MKKRSNRNYIEDIFTAIEEVASFIAGMTKTEFMRDRKTVNAVIRSFEVIGEAAKKIPESIRKKHPAVPWKRMAGMRDKMIHEYFGVDLAILWQTAKVDIPKLREPIEKLRGEIE